MEDLSFKGKEDFIFTFSEEQKAELRQFVDDPAFIWDLEQVVTQYRTLLDIEENESKKSEVENAVKKLRDSAVDLQTELTAASTIFNLIYEEMTEVGLSAGLMDRLKADLISLIQIIERLEKKIVSKGPEVQKLESIYRPEVAAKVKLAGSVKGILEKYGVRVSTFPENPGPMVLYIVSEALGKHLEHPERLMKEWRSYEKRTRSI